LNNYTHLQDAHARATETISVGISACLVGERVRFDAGHKKDAYITGTLAQYFTLIPICPEAAVGLGTPRPPIRLVGEPANARAVRVDDPSIDVTKSLAKYGRKMARSLPEISGYILKNRSPSCGMERVNIYPEKGPPRKSAQGIYARHFMLTNPLVPVEEEGRLGDAVLRENFIERVFAYHRWQCLRTSGLSAKKLIDFHTRHKLLLMAHNEKEYRALGPLVAQSGKLPFATLRDRYISTFMEILRHKATRRRHTNVLLHVFGYLKKKIDAEDKMELVDLIEQYRLGLVPLIVPITLLQHFFRRYPDPYITQQYYLSPHPKELMLRNYI
jgi:uncharacterized protein YbgA (DUF1722 family)/uncharacterized protein YbbK (DUF523 family)